jgi:hypothetical protein
MLLRAPALSLDADEATALSLLTVLPLSINCFDCGYFHSFRQFCG